MKTKRLFLSLVTMLVTIVSWADVAINETNFPDANFRSFLTSQYYGSDGIITDSEIQNITIISVDGMNIRSLQGIRYFTSLQLFACSNNNLTSLDVSGCTQLTQVECYNNQLTSLNVSGCTALRYLSCYNNKLTSLDVSSCTSLVTLKAYNNQITSIDLSKNTSLSKSDTDISGNPLTGVIEGSCGSNARYSLNLGSGAFAITGTGAINDYESSSNTTPWYLYRDYVKTANIANGITRIGIRTFRYCKSLTSVSIPNSVTSIGESAFGHCDALTSFTLPNSVTEVGDWIFEDIDNFPVTVYNSSCFVILQSSYQGAYTIPAGIKTICGGAFYGCAGLTSVTIPSGATSIGEGTFEKCTGLTSVSIPNSVTYIGDEAFKESGLRFITIPSGVKVIGEEAFERCASLTSVTIPSSVISIGKQAFGSCINLIKINSRIRAPFAINENVFQYHTPSATLYVPVGTKSLYANAAGWSQFTNIVETDEGDDEGGDDTSIIEGSCGTNSRYSFNLITGVLSITGTGAIDWKNSTDANPDYIYAFSDYVKTFIIANGITQIGDNAFEGCKNLTSVSIPNSVTSIGDEAFGATGLISVTIPNSVTNIGDEAFEKCPSLETVVFPSNVVNIGAGIFKDCTALKSPIYTGSTFIFMPTSYSGAYTIPANIKTIAPSAFDKCKGVTSVIIPDGVTSIGDYAFYNCSALAAVNIPEGVTTIGRSAFYDCSALAAVNIPEGVMTIGRSAFYGCSGEVTIACNIPSASASYNSPFSGSKFTSVVISNGVTSVGDYAFYGCDSLKTVTIPGSVNYIGEYGFRSQNIKDIYNYASTPQSIDYYTFSSYSASTTLHVRNGYKDAYKNANYWKIFTIVDDLYDNVIYAKETSVQSATFTVPVVARHTMKVSGFSFNFKCPEGFTVKKISRGAATKERDESEEYYFNTFKSSLKDGMYYVLCTTTQDYFLPESEEDEIAVITLEAGMDAKNGDYPLAVIDGELAYDKENARVEYYEKPLHFEFLPGDANGDGRISIADVTAIASYLLGNQPEVFYKNAAAIANGYDDVDEHGDPRLSVGDITAIVNILLKKN